MALLTVTHDLAFAEHWADAVALLRDGQLTRPLPSARFLARKRRRQRPGLSVSGRCPRGAKRTMTFPLPFAREAFCGLDDGWAL